MTMRDQTSPSLRTLVLGLLLLFSITGYLEACGPQVTSCKTDSECTAQEYCAPTSNNQSICVKRSESSADASPTDTITDTASEPRAENIPDGKPQPERTTETATENTPQPESSAEITPEIRPDTPTTTSCDIPSYDPAKDPGNGGKNVQLDNLDQLFFRKLREIFYISQQCSDKIWGGSYQLHKVPTYVANIGSNVGGSGQGIRGFLINHPNPPQGSTLVDSKLVFGIPNVYAYDASIKDITQPGFMFDLSVNNVSVFAFSYGTSDFLIDPTAGNEVYALYVHEAFHRIQDFEEAWDYPMNGIQDPTGYPYNVEQLTLTLIEDAILIDGYNGKITPEQALQWFYAVRKERIKIDNSPNKLIQSLENFQEWLEGTAMYSEILYLDLLKIPYSANDPNSIPGRLELMRLVESDPNATKEDVINTLGGRYYASGAAVGVLLERLGNKTWKDQIRKAKTFYDILNGLYANLQTDNILQQVKTTYNYEEQKKTGQSLAGRQ
jgi:hypothetical protein